MCKTCRNCACRVQCSYSAYWDLVWNYLTRGFSKETLSAHDSPERPSPSGFSRWSVIIPSRAKKEHNPHTLSCSPTSLFLMFDFLCTKQLPKAQVQIPLFGALLNKNCNVKLFLLTCIMKGAIDVRMKWQGTRITRPSECSASVCVLD